MKIKVRNHTKLNITFEGKEQLTLKPGAYLQINSNERAIHKGKFCYKCEVWNYHSDAVHKFNESGYFLASREVLARILASKDVVIF